MVNYAMRALAPTFVEQVVERGGTGIAVGAPDEYVVFSELFAAGVRDAELDTTLTISCNCPQTTASMQRQNSHLCWLREDIIAVCATIRSRELRWQHGQFFARKVHSSANADHLVAMVQPDPAAYLTVRDKCQNFTLNRNDSVRLTCYFEPYNLSALWQPNG